MTIRVGFLGGGFIAHYHGKMLHTSGADVEIAVVHDPDPAKEAGFAAASGARPVSSEDELLSSVDAVYICTWTAEHPRLVGELHAQAFAPPAEAWRRGHREGDATRERDGAPVHALQLAAQRAHLAIGGTTGADVMDGRDCCLRGMHKGRSDMRMATRNRRNGDGERQRDKLRGERSHRSSFSSSAPQGRRRGCTNGWRPLGGRSRAARFRLPVLMAYLAVLFQLGALGAPGGVTPVTRS